MSRFVSMLLVAVCMWCILNETLDRPAKANLPADSEKKDWVGSPTKIALVDVAAVFKASKAFERARDVLKLKIADAEDTAKTMTAEIQKMAQKFKELDSGSEERKELEVRLKRKSAEFEEFKKAGARKFLKEESEIYVNVYKTVTKEVATYAQTHGIDLVIRHNAEEINQDDPQKTIQSLNRQVVYENKLDITEEIIAAIADQ